MRAVLVAAGLLATVGSGGAADGPEMTRIESKDGRFSARWPAKPKRDAKTLRSTAGELRAVTEAVALKDGLTLSVTYTDYPPAFGKLDPTQLLNAVRDGMGSKDARLSEAIGQPVGADGVAVNTPGREFTWDHGKTIARTRLFLVGTRLYQVTASGPKDAVHTKTGEVFLLSFEPWK